LIYVLLVFIMTTIFTPTWRFTHCNYDSFHIFCKDLWNVNKYQYQYQHVPHRRQQQLPLNCKILVPCRSVAKDLRLLRCDTAVIGNVVTSVSKYHSVFIYKVRQSLNLKAWLSFENLEMTQLTMAEYPTRFKSSSNMLIHLYQVTWHHVPHICTLDTHNGKKLEFNLCKYYL